MARWRPDMPEREVTPEHLYLRRREFLGLGAAGAIGALFGAGPAGAADDPGPQGTPLEVKARSERAGGEELTPWDDVTSYNNFYELGTGKEDPKANAGTLRPRPWSVRIDGEVKRPLTLDVDALLRWAPLEERVYRMRCVEAWSMVIPWAGWPLAELVKRAEPTSRAKYVRFETLLDPAQLPGQRREVLPWPYVEGLRMDEAMHPLTFLAFGLYGRVLPGQNGAPVRLVVPWKYGFKGVKSIVRISFVAEQPSTTWAESSPSEYGFYANVNPEVDHPRWSQGRERRIGELRRRKTLPFNGYAAEVAPLYAGMDLAKFF